jgi:6-phospho-3-hexuloisomerase
MTTRHAPPTDSQTRATTTAVLGEIASVVERVDPYSIIQAVDLIHRAPRVFLCGEGRSGLMARAFAMRLMHLGITAYVIGETTTPAVAAGDCLVAVSGSGETHATVYVSELSKRSGATLFAVTAGRQSALADASDLVLILPAATKHRRADEPETVQPLSSLFDQASHVVFDVISVALARRREIDNEQARLMHANTE